MKQVRSFRLGEDRISKLNKITEYHQQNLKAAFVLSKVENTINLNRTMIIRGLIDQEYNKLVQEGLIKE